MVKGKVKQDDYNLTIVEPRLGVPNPWVKREAPLSSASYRPAPATLG